VCHLLATLQKYHQRNEEKALHYIASLSEKISKIAKKVNIRTVFTAKNTLKSMLVNLKPKSERPRKKVIYKIPM
jgi:uncharacterized FlaG/YvyC family protein